MVSNALPICSTINTNTTLTTNKPLLCVSLLVLDCTSLDEPGYLSRVCQGSSAFPFRSDLCLSADPVLNHILLLGWWKEHQYNLGPAEFPLVQLPLSARRPLICSAESRGGGSAFYTHGCRPAGLSEILRLFLLPSSISANLLLASLLGWPNQLN